MNDIDEFLAMMLAIFAGIVLLMILLTYLETTLVEPLRPRRRVLRKKAAPGRHRQLTLPGWFSPCGVQVSKANS